MQTGLPFDNEATEPLSLKGVPVAIAIFFKFQALTTAAVSVKPNPTALPGLPAAEKLVNGLAAFILLACVVGALFGIGQWVLGSKSNNYSQADSGRSKVAIAAGGAFLVGALATIINFFESAGGAVK